MANVTAETKSDSSKFSYLDLLASLGSAKHIGGKGATDALLNEVDVKPGSTVLDVGCGMGKTSCKLAASGCRVVGLDIMPQMIRQSRARARKMGVGDRTTFLRCDAKHLPFRPEAFDHVVVESVTVFVEEVERALQEYHRVVKTGGSVCDNEVCVTRDAMASMGDRLDSLKSIFTAFQSATNRGVLTFEDWKELFEQQFGNVKASHHIIDMNVEMETRREDGFTTFKAMLKSMWLYMTNPEAKRIMDEGQKMVNFKDEFGYGLYVSRK